MSLIWNKAIVQTALPAMIGEGFTNAQVSQQLNVTNRTEASRRYFENRE